MLIDPQLRERILRSLRWLVRDATYRFDDCKENLQPGSEGGYSPELKEAHKLLKELEQGELLLGRLPAPGQWTEEECVDRGRTLGMTYKDSIEFYLHYAPLWIRGNGKPMVDLTLEMRRWNMRSLAGESKADRKTQLFPLPGKMCSTDGCGVPAVYKSSGGAYDFFYCKQHIPEPRKLKMREQGYDV
jgi:hypothetical protein